MNRALWTASSAFLVALLALAAYASFGSDSAAQGLPTLAVDASSDGNSATILGSIEGCLEVKTGDAFTVDIGVKDVVDLGTWEVTFIYDNQVLRVVDANGRMFLASAPGSNLIVQSDLLPPSQFFPHGGFFIGAADRNRDATETGSGVLARLSLEAIGPGISEAAIPQGDLDGNGTMDFGPRLLAGGGESEPIGDVNGDRFFDGPTFHARVAVDKSCAEQAPTPTPPPPPPPPPPSPSPTPSPLSGTTPQPGPDGGTVIIEGEEESGPAAQEEAPLGGEEEAGPESPGRVFETPAGEQPPEGEQEPPSQAVLAIETPSQGPEGPSQPRTEAGGDRRSSPEGLPYWIIAPIVFGILVLGSGSFVAVRALRK